MIIQSFEPNLGQGCVHRVSVHWSLQIEYPASFISNPLFIPFPQDSCQVFLDSHLFPVTAVAVGKDAIGMSL